MACGSTGEHDSSPCITTHVSLQCSMPLSVTGWGHRAASSSARLDTDFDPGTLISATTGRQGGATLMARAMVHVTSQTGTGRALRATGQPISDMSTTLTQASLPGDEEEFFLSFERAAAAAGRGRERGTSVGSWYVINSWSRGGSV